MRASWPASNDLGRAPRAPLWADSMFTRTLSELAQTIGAVLDGDGSRPIHGLAGLADVGPTDVSFLANPRYRAQLDATCAVGLLVAPDLQVARTDLALLRCQDPNRAWIEVIRLFAPAPAAPTPG